MQIQITCYAWEYIDTHDYLLISNEDEICKFSAELEASFKHQTEIMMDWSNFSDASKLLKINECVQSIKRILNKRELVSYEN